MDIIDCFPLYLLEIIALLFCDLLSCYMVFRALKKERFDE